MGVYRATTSFAAFTDGTPRVVTAGELVDDSDPVFKGRAANFEAVEDAVAQQKVERATAAPGEKRSVEIPDGDESAESVEYSCDDCEFTSASERGLNIHRRVHDE